MHNLQHFVKCGDISFFRRAHNVSTSQMHRQLNCFAHILARNSIKPTKDCLHAFHSERKRRKPCTSLTAAQPPGPGPESTWLTHNAHCTGQDPGETAWQRPSQDVHGFLLFRSEWNACKQSFVGLIELRASMCAKQFNCRCI
jgi:hypothetical protein